MKWNDDLLKWEIVHYTHSFDDFERMTIKYPMPEHIHLVDVMFAKSHSTLERVKAFKERTQG